MIAISVVFVVAMAQGEASDIEAARAAVLKGLPLIQKSAIEYPKHRDCFSCHHQALAVFAMSTAKARGFAIDSEAISASIDQTHEDLKSALTAYKSGGGQGGGVTRAGYALFTLEIGGSPRDDVTDAVAGYLVGRDSKVDHWITSSNRPPSESSHFTTTYLALRGLRSYGVAAEARTIEARRNKARKWLLSTAPRDTEDRVFRLLALKEVGAPGDGVASASGALRATQNSDGGWSQRDGDKSDAYATGSALVALNIAGEMSTQDDAYLRGMRFLIRTQRDDGSWFVGSRSQPFQTYFESGFPHGKDQFISIAGSSWAVAALALACPIP